MRGRVGRAGGLRRGAAIALLLTLGLAGCGGGGGSADSASAGAGSGSMDFDQPARSSADGSAGGSQDRVGLQDNGVSTGDVAGAKRPEIQTRSVISTGQVELEADDLGQVRSEIDRLLGRYGGFVAKEETHNDDGGRTAHSTLQLRVPSQRFDDVMGAFAEFSTVVDASRKAEDVTTEVIDVDSRIRTMEISLERLRKFLGRAHRAVDMIRLESEIAEREADLASLRSQQDYLDDQTSLATITVRMALTPEKATEEDPLEGAGFVTGLRNGWNALVDVVIVVATGLGALLPFLGVLAVVLVPLVLWLRTVRRRSPGADPAQPAP